jgi:hypothetical protein
MHYCLLPRFVCRYCYTRSNGGRDPVILLSDNGPAHLPPPEAGAWSSGSLKGYRLSNILVIFFEPNCTSQVQPLDAGCIQSAKALYRKRHMAWVLSQLNIAKETGSRPDIRCNIRQAIEWFMAAIKAVPDYTVKNCWAACKIMPLEHQQELETGVRHNNRPANTLARARAGVPADQIEELSQLLSQLSTGLSNDDSHKVSMVEAVDLLDLEFERECFDTPGIFDEDDGEDGEECDDLVLGNEYGTIDVVVEGDTNDADPPPMLTLAQARDVSDRLFAFVTANTEHIERAGQSMGYDYVGVADTLRFAISRMQTTSSARQSSISEFMSEGNSS